MQEINISLITLLPILYKWRKQIFIVSLIAGIGTLMISLFLPNYYESEIKFMANNTQASSPNAVFGGGVNYPYGSSEDNERLITIAESGELMDFLIDSLHLTTHYGIDSNDVLARFKTQKELERLYTVTRNIHGGVAIKYQDKNAAFAANVLTVAIHHIAALDHAAATTNLVQISLALAKAIAEKQKLIQTLTDSINHINRQYKYASMQLRQQALVQASPAMTNDMQWELIRKAANISPDSLANIQEALTLAGFWDSRRADLHANAIAQQEMLSRVKTTLEANTQTLQVLEKANIPLHKCRPQRILLILGATIFSFLFSVFGILLYEKMPPIKL